MSRIVHVQVMVKTLFQDGKLAVVTTEPEGPPPDDGPVSTLTDEDHQRIAREIVQEQIETVSRAYAETPLDEIYALADKEAEGRREAVLRRAEVARARHANSATPGA